MVVFTTTLVWSVDKLVIVKLFAPRLNVSSVTAFINPLLLWTIYLSASKGKNETLVIPVISDVFTDKTPAAVVVSPVTWWFNIKFDLSKSTEDTFSSGKGAINPLPALIVGAAKNASTWRLTSLAAGKLPNIFAVVTPAFIAAKVISVLVSDIAETLLKTSCEYCGLKYLIISFTLRPPKPPLIEGAVAIPDALTSILTTPLGNLNFSKIESAEKSGKPVTPVCFTDLILLVSKTVTVPMPIDKSAPFTTRDSPAMKVPDVWRSCIVSVLLIPATAKPVAPLFFPSINDDFGIVSLPYFAVFKINFVYVCMSYKCKFQFDLSSTSGASAKLNP